MTPIRIVPSVLFFAFVGVMLAIVPSGFGAEEVSMAELAGMCAPAPSGLVAWWRAETNATDSVGTNNGFAFNPKFFAGKVGQAFSTGGIYVVISNSPSLRFTNAMSIEGWINPALITDTRTIISKYDYLPRNFGGTNSSFNFGLTNNGRLFFMVSSNGHATQNTRVISDYPVPVNKWTHVAATYNGETLRLYTNGVLAAQVNYSGGIFPGTSAIGIGALPYFGLFVQPFAGLIDELSLYNRALSQSEILSIVNADSNGKCFPPGSSCAETPAGLISWWPGDGNTQDAMGTNSVAFASLNYVTGEVDRAFSFFGSANYYAVVPNSPSLNFASNVNFTIETWIRTSITNTLATNVVLIEKRFLTGQTGVGYSLSLNNGRLAFWLGTSPFTLVSPTNSMMFIAPGPDLRDGLFHHVAVSLDREHTNAARLFVDGKLVLTFDAFPFRGDLSNQNTLFFARQANAPSGAFFGGEIDEAAIYRRALAESEIAAIFNSVSHGKCKIPPIILTQPLSQRVTIGSNATFSVSAGGSPKLRYQWLRNGSAIVGATNSVYTFQVFEIATVINPPKDSYSVRVTNLFGGVTSSNAILTVNHRPVAFQTNVTVLEDGTVEFSLPANDIDADSLAFNIVSPPAHGTLSGDGGNCVYTPSPLFHGEDSFVFKVNDGLVDSLTAKVNITVVHVNHPPVAHEQTISLDEDTTANVPFAASDADADPLTFTIVMPPAHGVLIGNIYMPNTNYFGTDSFTFRAGDGQTNSNTATVNVTIRPVNDAPVARFTISPLASIPDFTNQIVFAPLNGDAIVVLDASASSDIESDPLEFFWLEGTNQFASGMIVTNEFAPATHEVKLVVSDGQISDEVSQTFEVLTPAQSVALLMTMIDGATLKNKQSLVTTLNSSIRAFERGNVTAAVNELKAFQSKVKAQVQSADAALAAKLISTAQQFIETFQR